MRGLRSLLSHGPSIITSFTNTCVWKIYFCVDGEIILLAEESEFLDLVTSVPPSTSQGDLRPIVMRLHFADKFEWIRMWHKHIMQ